VLLPQRASSERRASPCPYVTKGSLDHKRDFPVDTFLDFKNMSAPSADTLIHPNAPKDPLRSVNPTPTPKTLPLASSPLPPTYDRLSSVFIAPPHRQRTLMQTDGSPTFRDCLETTTMRMSRRRKRTFRRHPLCLNRRDREPNLCPIRLRQGRMPWMRISEFTFFFLFLFALRFFKVAAANSISKLGVTGLYMDSVPGQPVFFFPVRRRMGASSII
jgi:hypothetical protein